MGITWMPLEDLTEAIPPAYTEWVGRQLVIALDRRTAGERALEAVAA
jgi:DNA (cytosine-5)-methyltransferase 1